jgi:hypothetical protein
MEEVGVIVYMFVQCKWSKMCQQQKPCDSLDCKHDPIVSNINHHHHHRLDNSGNNKGNTIAATTMKLGLKMHLCLKAQVCFSFFTTMLTNAS